MKITIVGHSHIGCMRQAYLSNSSEFAVNFNFFQLHKYKKGHMPRALNLSIQNVDLSYVKGELHKALEGSSAAVLLLTSNAPAIFGLKRFKSRNKGHAQSGFSAEFQDELSTYMAAYADWLAFLNAHIPVPVRVLPLPPPVGSNDWIQKNPGHFKAIFDKTGISSPEHRLGIYQLWLDAIRKEAAKQALDFIELPGDVFADGGFLSEQYCGDDPSHANVEYGLRMLHYLSQVAKEGDAGKSRIIEKESAPESVTLSHPYSALPDTALWKQAVANIPADQLDPVSNVPFRISRSDKVATAGSCFAQHISKRIRSSGFQFLVTERSDSVCEEGNEHASYDFSARYGNIYTARQLLQLFDRAFGHFTPVDNCWELSGGGFCDPFRPRIEPGGFPTLETLEADRRKHLQAVQEMFLQLDVFVFTMGLTEGWVSRLDGAAYPVAPGVIGGVFDPSKYAFVNYDVNDVVADLKSMIQKLRQVNAKAKLILTVSPVPLTATYEPDHVLVSTTYSKSVLRVAAEMVSRSSRDVYYFPSFEIITGNYNRGRYFAPDLRNVTTAGVDHVMAVFMKHLTEETGTTTMSDNPAADAGQIDKEMREMMEVAEAACDDELLERE